jgi:alpha-glutamyl/putrescinyl thymine pyrophosphorylase clade 1
MPGPWTDDPVLSRHKFTNVYRAADRVSQYLIRDVVYAGPQDPEEVVFRVLLFKFFNRIETWKLLCDRLGGMPSWEGYRFAAYNQSSVRR